MTWFIQYKRDNGTVGSLEVVASSKQAASREFAMLRPEGHVLAVVSIA